MSYENPCGQEVTADPVGELIRKVGRAALAEAEPRLREGQRSRALGQAYVETLADWRSNQVTPAQEAFDRVWGTVREVDPSNFRVTFYPSNNSCVVKWVSDGQSSVTPTLENGFSDAVSVPHQLTLSARFNVGSDPRLVRSLAKAERKGRQDLSALGQLLNGEWLPNDISCSARAGDDGFDAQISRPTGVAAEVLVAGRIDDEQIGSDVSPRDAVSGLFDYTILERIIRNAAVISNVASYMQ